MVTIASLSASPSSHGTHARKSGGRSLVQAGQSMLASAGGGLSSSVKAAAGGASSGLSTGLKAIQNAVTAALQKAKQNGTSTDPDEIIQNAIKKLFKSGLVSPGQASDGLAEDDASGPSSTSSTSAPQTFEQVLQSFGVSAAQFRKDLSASIQQATADTADPSSPSQAIRSGSLLNVTG